MRKTQTKSPPKKAAVKKAGAVKGVSHDSKKLQELVRRTAIAFDERKLRFTDLREQVFTEIASTRGSIGAYDILESLAEKGTRLAPISVYRSIDALMDVGVIHRLESKNAFFACRRHEHGKKGRPIFLFCEKCGGVSEVVAQTIFDTINALSDEVGFDAKVKFVEVSGVCADCRKKPM